MGASSPNVRAQQPGCLSAGLGLLTHAPRTKMPTVLQTSSHRRGVLPTVAVNIV